MALAYNIPASCGHDILTIRSTRGFSFLRGGRHRLCVS